MAKHVSDLKAVVEEAKKPCVSLLMDNGPDQTIKSDKNVFALWRLFTTCKLDTLTAGHYAPGDSAQNPIEHQWSPRSRDLVGVYLSPCLPGEDKPPAAQKLTPDETDEKEKQVYDLAIARLNSFWDGKSYDGFNVSSIGVPCAGEKLMFSDWETVESFLQCHSNATLHSIYSDYVAEYKLLVKHLQNKIHMLVFSKCHDITCPNCGENPPLSHTWKNLSKRVFTPIPSDLIPGSFRTYLEMKTGAAPATLLDDHTKHCPSTACGVEALRCTSCINLLFMSQAALERHCKICHNTSKKRKRAKTTGHTCTFEGCNLIFTTNYQLTKHKKTEGHMCKRGRQSVKQL